MNTSKTKFIILADYSNPAANAVFKIFCTNENSGIISTIEKNAAFDLMLKGGVANDGSAPFPFRTGDTISDITLSDYAASLETSLGVQIKRTLDGVDLDVISMAASPNTLAHGALDGATVSLVLTNGVFESDIVKEDITIPDAPVELTIASITHPSPNTVVATLALASPVSAGAFKFIVAKEATGTDKDVTADFTIS